MVGLVFLNVQVIASAPVIEMLAVLPDMVVPPDGSVQAMFTDHGAWGFSVTVNNPLAGVLKVCMFWRADGLGRVLSSSRVKVVG